MKTTSATLPGKTEIKIAYIGGGSREWAVKLMSDLALSEKLCGSLVLYDIDHPAALHNQKLAQEVFNHPQALTRFDVRAEAHLADALKGADFVMISIEPGPTTLRHADLEIPAKYGIIQTVGDTTGPGGILRALRCVPIYEGFAAAIMEHCPQAWVINYTNPMAICTASLFAAAPGIKAFGCCHEVFGTQAKFAELAAKQFDVPKPEWREVALTIAGVNHFTWATRASWRGHDLMPRCKEIVRENGHFPDMTEKAKLAVKNNDVFGGHGLIADDLLRRFDALGAAGDRHLAEFVPWYLSSEAEMHRWGIVCTPYSFRLQRSQKPRPTAAEVVREKLCPSGEEGVMQMEALLGLRHLVTNVNLPNQGQMPSYPRGAIVETYAEFRQNLLRPVVADELPPGADLLVRRAVGEQSLTLAAALQRDRELAFQALLTSPLVRIPVEKAWAMFGEMIDATRDMLPGWK